MDMDSILPYTKDLAVLYVEDSMTVRKLIQKRLLKAFRHVEVATDGEEGFVLYREYYERNDRYFDLLITDLEMPNMDGLKLSKIALDFNPSQEIIVLSANTDFHRIIDLINLGVHKFILKPIEDGQFYQVILDVAQKIRLKRLKEEEQEEIEEYNAILKERESVYLKTLEGFKTALDTSAIISKTDIDGTITYVNDKFCKISGYSKEELIGVNHRIVNSQNMKQSFYDKMWKTILDKKSFKALFENRTKDGNLYYLQSVINPILNPEMEIVEFIAISFDMTKLVSSMKNLKNAEKSKEEFFINISHEMRTPLNAIMGFASILKKHLKEDPANLQIINTIQESGSDLQHLIESILDLNKLKENKLTLDIQPFDPLEVFTKESQYCLQKALKKEQIYTATIDPSLPASLMGDSLRITQILRILLDNAVKFTPDKGRISLDIHYDEGDQRLHCTIKDNGIGIAKEHQASIFTFAQIDGSFTRSHEGTGIGLRIASALLLLMKGDIDLQSQPGKGACFTIQIPLKQT